MGEGEALGHPEADQGWTGLATTVRPEPGTDTALLQASQEPHPTVAPGVRWPHDPGGHQPRVAGEARTDGRRGPADGGGLPGVPPAPAPRPPVPARSRPSRCQGTQGTTATPTAAVVLALLAQVALGQCWRGDQEMAQVDGLQPPHRLSCDALGLDHSCYEVPSAHQIAQFSQAP